MRNSGEAGLVQITHKKTEPALGCQLLISVSQEEFGGPTISRPNYLNGRRQYLNLPPHTLSRTRNIRTRQSFFVYNPHPANLPGLQWLQMYRQAGENAVTPKQQLASI